VTDITCMCDGEEVEWLTSHACVTEWKLSDRHHMLLCTGQEGHFCTGRALLHWKDTFALEGHFCTGRTLLHWKDTFALEDTTLCIATMGMITGALLHVAAPCHAVMQLRDTLCIEISFESLLHHRRYQCVACCI
jgi:hypothetical protein